MVNTIFFLFILNNTLCHVHSASTPTFSECCDEINIELCEKLKTLIREYFTHDNLSTLIQKPNVCYTFSLFLIIFKFTDFILSSFPYFFCYRKK